MEDVRIGECLFESLLRYRLPEMVPEPAAAEQYTVSPDGLTYTFTIRSDARWSNGDPLTSHDFSYAWLRALSPDLAADYSELFFLIRGASDFFDFRAAQLKAFAASNKAESTTQPRADPAQLWREALEFFDKHVAITTPDDKTLVVTLAQPTPYFPELCAFMTLAPVHAKTVEAQVTFDPVSGRRVQDPMWTKPGRLVSNGPYVLASRRFKRDLHLTANPHYWNRSAMRNQSILQLVISDPMTQLLAYQRGEVDWLPDIPSNSPLAADLVRQMREGQRPDAKLVPMAGTYFYNLNCSEKLVDGSPNPLSDERVRLALSKGIDRRTIVERVTRLGQPIAATFVPPGAIAGYTPPTDGGVTFDPDGARKLLAEAGHPNGAGLDGLSILYNTEGAHADIAQQIKRSWEENLGVSVTLSGVEKSVFGARLRSKDFTICRASWFGDYRDPTTFLDKFISTNGNNDAGYSNPKFDDLMKQAAGETDAPARMRKLQQAETLMLRQCPIAPIFHYSVLQLFDEKRVQNLYTNAWNFRRLEFVSVQRQR
jgi:oligopeptide transport system substrate-binding protein